MGIHSIKKGAMTKEMTKKSMTEEDKIRFLETSITSLEGLRSKFVMNLEYGKGDIPEVEQTISELKEELQLLRAEGKKRKDQ